jgi:hypothetical protein
MKWVTVDVYIAYKNGTWAEETFQFEIWHDREYSIRNENAIAQEVRDTLKPRFETDMEFYMIKEWDYL